jgi:hypothetical protein
LTIPAVGAATSIETGSLVVVAPVVSVAFAVSV